MGNFLISLLTDADEERAKKKALEKKRAAIYELITSEEFYVRYILEKLCQSKKYLSAVLDDEGIRFLFSNIEDILTLHRNLLSLMSLLIANAQQSQIGLAFVHYKFDFTAYAIYCTRLPRANQYYELITNGDNPEVLSELIKWEKLANENSSKEFPDKYKPYTLKSMIQEPPMRCYKYVEFLKGIATLCNDKKSVEYECLYLASEVMTDISQMCNISLRDRENLDVMTIVEANLANINLNEGDGLAQFGHLRKYGKLSLEFPQDGERYERVCFVFDKLLMITRSAYERYYYENCLVLDQYSLGTVSGDKLLTQAKRNAIGKAFNLVHAKYRTMFYLDANDKTVAPYSIKFYCENERKKNEWTIAIRSAKRNTQPAGYRANRHKFYMHTFSRAHDCDYCGRLMKGLIWQGYVCAVTNKMAHRQCIPSLTTQSAEDSIISRVVSEPLVKVVHIPSAISQSLSIGPKFKFSGKDYSKRSILSDGLKITDLDKELERSGHGVVKSPKKTKLKQSQEKKSQLFSSPTNQANLDGYIVPQPVPSLSSKLKLRRKSADQKLPDRPKRPEKKEKYCYDFKPEEHVIPIVISGNTEVNPKQDCGIEFLQHFTGKDSQLLNIEQEVFPADSNSLLAFDHLTGDKQGTCHSTTPFIHAQYRG